MTTYTENLPFGNQLIVQSIYNTDYNQTIGGEYFVGTLGELSSGTEYQVQPYSFQLSIENSAGVTTDINLPEYVVNALYDEYNNNLIIVTVPSLTTVTAETVSTGDAPYGPSQLTATAPLVNTRFMITISQPDNYLPYLLIRLLKQLFFSNVALCYSR
jgi:hypothetical protein